MGSWVRQPSKAGSTVPYWKTTLVPPTSRTWVPDGSVAGWESRTGPFAAAVAVPSAARAVCGQAGRATTVAAPSAVTTVRRDKWVDSVMTGGSSMRIRVRPPHSLDNPVTLVKDYS